MINNSIHNPNYVKPGDIVVLDEYSTIHSNVKVKSVAPLGIFAEVYDIDKNNPNDCWTVMTYRLSFSPSQN